MLCDSKRSLKKKTFAVDIDGTITLNGMGTIHLEALSKLRSLKDDGHNVVLVTGRSSVEGYLLSIFGGLTHLSVGENGGCITYGDKIQHKLLGNKGECIHALATIQSRIDILINNAGTNIPEHFTKVKRKNMEYLVKINTISSFNGFLVPLYFVLPKK